MPKAVREALARRSGDAMIFRVEDGHAILAKTADFHFRSIAGTVTPRAGKRGAPGDEIVGETRRARAERAS